MTNEELVQEIQLGHDVQKNLTQLYEQNKNFIYKLVKPLVMYADIDDLLQEAYIGFHDAVFKYVPGEAQFITYYPYRVRKQCIKYLENTSNSKRIPGTMQEMIRKYKKFIAQYKNDNGIDPSEKDIISGLGLTKRRLERIKKTIYEMECVSIHDIIPGTEGYTFEEVISDDNDMMTVIEEKQMQEQTRKVLDEAISSLSDLQSEVITSRYWNDESQIQIAERMHVSNSYVSQLERDAIRKLRKLEKVQNLLDSYDYNSRISFHFSVKNALDNSTSATEQLAMKRIEMEERLKKEQNSMDNLFSMIVSG